MLDLLLMIGLLLCLFFIIVGFLVAIFDRSPKFFVIGFCICLPITIFLIILDEPNNQKRNNEQIRKREAYEKAWKEKCYAHGGSIGVVSKLNNGSDTFCYSPNGGVMFQK